MAEIPPGEINSNFRNTKPTPKGEEQGKSDKDQGSSLPKGVVLDKEGKPCRLCTSVASWKALTKRAKESPPSSSTTTTDTSTAGERTTFSSLVPPAETISAPTFTSECPPDVEALGRSTWTLLHSLTATYPERANQEQQNEMGSFIRLFSNLYPCWVCADDFRAWMNDPSSRNQPRLSTRQDFGTWMCEAHNEVNRKLGKKEFDCRFWEERWRTGWKDGRCD